MLIGEDTSLLFLYDWRRFVLCMIYGMLPDASRTLQAVEAFLHDAAVLLDRMLL